MVSRCFSKFMIERIFKIQEFINAFLPKITNKMLLSDSALKLASIEFFSINSFKDVNHLILLNIWSYQFPSVKLKSTLNIKCENEPRWSILMPNQAISLYSKRSLFYHFSFCFLFFFLCVSFFNVLGSLIFFPLLFLFFSGFLYKCKPRIEIPNGCLKWIRTNKDRDINILTTNFQIINT